MNLNEILKFTAPFLNGKNVKLVRHADGRKEQDFSSLRKNRERLLFYQKCQSQRKFDNAEYIVSFLGLESTKSLLIGIFKVNGCKEVNGFNSENNQWSLEYDLEEVIDEKVVNELYNRVIIDWGKSTISWCQNYEHLSSDTSILSNSKEVLEILPKGYIGDFPGYNELILDMNDLRKLFDSKSANQKWETKLSSVSGIYLILDTKTGNQYIGSAYGKDGIWGRWKCYVENGHGGNEGLKPLKENDPNYDSNFQFSILMTLPANMNKDEVIMYENKCKLKLGSRVFGYNKN